MNLVMQDVYPLVFSLLTQMQPYTHERVPAITLSNHCKQVQIIEWQDKPEKILPSVRLLNKSCNHAVDGFNQFLYSKGLPTVKQLNLRLNVSLLIDQTHSRGLNDNLRFKNRYSELDANGKIIEIFGYYHLSTQHIFMFNQLWHYEEENRKFATVFEHEIFHALIDQNNIFYSLPEPKNEVEERWAREFTVSLGLGR